MTALGLYGVNRRAPRSLLLGWEAVDRSLVPRTTAGAGILSRASIGSVVDQNGVVARMANNAPRFGCSGANQGLLLEGARTNVVVQSDAISTANGWTLQTTAATTPGYANAGAVSLTRITNGGAGITRVITLTGNGPKAISMIVQFDGVAGSTPNVCCLFDNTASAFLADFSVTWAADGTATCSAVTGTLLAFERLGPGTYRILGQSLAATAAHTNSVYVTTSVVSITFRVGAVQIEDALIPSSIISTTTTAVTRSPDVLRFPINTLPRPLAMYVRFVERGAVVIPNSYIASIADVSGAPGFSITSNGGPYLAACLAVTSQVSGSPAIGDLVELMAQINEDGSIQLTQSINGGALSIGAVSAADNLGGSWTGTSVVTLGGLPPATAANALGVFQALRIGDGNPTFAQMQQLALN